MRELSCNCFIYFQVDCPEDIPAYIHRVGRTARFTSEGKSVLFLLPSEKEMLTKLQAVDPKIPIQLKKVNTCVLVNFNFIGLICI